MSTPEEIRPLLRDSGAPAPAESRGLLPADTPPPARADWKWLEPACYRAATVRERVQSRIFHGFPGSGVLRRKPATIAGADTAIRSHVAGRSAPPGSVCRGRPGGVIGPRS